ncbi:hypothetical protein [Gilvibacter sediminis]|uniref:hypothetical protein n=1 Tax=Gilvibacter sediminis TaxID=379071 RepID=UPI0023506153|nr:hypothetical protein [Gilvibacter sediminis]MDC7997605.1 hypothetical protein [Gilvibacter sediminis]
MRALALLLTLFFTVPVLAQEERVYEFDLLAINYVTPIQKDYSPKKTYTAINSQDNSYHMFLQIDAPNDKVTITMIDNEEGWYSYSSMAWSAFDRVDVTIVLKQNDLSRLRGSKSYRFDFTPSGIQDTLISEKTYKTFSLAWTKKKRDIRHLFVVDTTFSGEKPQLSEELFSSNYELLERIPNGRLESVLYLKNGDPISRSDNLDYVPISVKVKVK